MAKAPKPPGKNGSAGVDELRREIETRAAVIGDSYWTAQVVTTSMGPLARLGGEDPARDLLPIVVRSDARNRAHATALIAAGLARRGEGARAAAVVAEAEAAVSDDRLEGETACIAWGFIARAHHAAGADVDVDRCLDLAEAAAQAEKSNPSQPWPHLAMARADTDRWRALVAQLPARDVSFDTEVAARLSISSAIARGDVDAVGALFAALPTRRDWMVREAFSEGLPLALKAGNAHRLLAVLKPFVEHYDTAYVLSLVTAQCVIDAVAVDKRSALEVLAWFHEQPWAHAGDRADAAAAAGDVAAARRLIAADSDTAEAERMACALVRLGDVDAALALLRVLPTPESKGAAIAALLRSSSSSTDRAALLERGAALIKGFEAPTACAALAEAGIAAVDVAGGAELILEAVALADAIPRSNAWTRNERLRTIGVRAAEAGQHAAGAMALKKATSKRAKPAIALALAFAYVRVDDVAGALVCLGHVAPKELKGLMNTCDVLSVLASERPTYKNYA